MLFMSKTMVNGFNVQNINCVIFKKYYLSSLVSQIDGCFSVKVFALHLFQHLESIPRILFWQHKNYP